MGFWRELSSGLQIDHFSLYPHTWNAETGSKLSHDSCKGTNLIYENSILMTSSNPNDLLKALPPKTIELRVGFQHTNFEGTETFIPNSHAVSFGRATGRKPGGVLFRGGCLGREAIPKMHWPLFFSLVSIIQSPAILCEGNEKIKQVPDIKELTLCLGQTSHTT